MIIGKTRKDEIKDTILKDLFIPAELRITDRKKKITEKSYYTWLAQHQKAIDALPAEFINHTKTVYMKVDGESKYEWSYTSPTLTPIIAAVKDTFRPNELPFPISDQYVNDVADICKDDKKLKEEKAEMVKYLHNSLSTWNTTAKLRKNWPEQLHKYIPIDPPRKPYKKQDVSADIEAPVAAIQQRLTTNLLENT